LRRCGGRSHWPFHMNLDKGKIHLLSFQVKKVMTTNVQILNNQQCSGLSRPCRYSNCFRNRPSARLERPSQLMGPQFRQTSSSSGPFYFLPASALGCRNSTCDALCTSLLPVTARRNLSHLKDGHPGVTDNLGPNLHELQLNAGGRPAGHLTREREAAQEVTHIVGQQRGTVMRG